MRVVILLRLHKNVHDTVFAVLIDVDAVGGAGQLDLVLVGIDVQLLAGKAAVVHGALKLIEHFRFLKPKTTRLEKLEASMDQYHETAAFWASHKLVILKVLLITMAQRILLFTVTYWVYRSLGFHGYSIITLTILQSVISVSVDMLPLPGGMGISESLYLVMFAPVFGEALLPAMLLSRGISYYAQMLISAVMTCVAYFIIGRKEQEEK